MLTKQNYFGKKIHNLTFQPFFSAQTFKIYLLRGLVIVISGKKQDVSATISAWNEQWVGQISAWGQMFKADRGHIELQILTNTGFFLKKIQNVTETPTADQQV